MSDTEQRQPDAPREPERLSTAALARSDAADAHDVAEPRSYDPGRARPEPTPLLAEDEAGDLRERWTTIQAAFVDEPRQAVQDADGLVALAMKRLAEMFADERSNLESQWDRGDQVSTEELRVALQRYRSFFDRLLSF
jgi:hypothetical protein